MKDIHNFKSFIQVNEASDESVTLKVTISNIDQSTAEDFLKMFTFMQWTRMVGASRGFESFFDGDGHFRPRISVEGHDLSKIDLSKDWDQDNDDRITLDFGA
jgi:hypothetical protein